MKCLLNLLFGILGSLLFESRSVGCPQILFLESGQQFFYLVFEFLFSVVSRQNY